MNRILLLPGQGAQFVGMAKAWCEKSPEASRVFAEADTVLAGQLPGGATVSELCFNGPVETLNRTDVSQPAIYTASVACWRGLLAAWGAGSFEEASVLAAAGLSLGEYTALHLAGSFTFADGLRLVALRGRAMQEAALAVESGMVALIGADEPQAQAVCDEARGPDVLVCANFNAPGQIVISGSQSACQRAVAVAERLGLRSAVLPVAGAFHSPIMAPAAAKLAEALSRTPISPPRCTVVSNVTAKPHSADENSGAGIDSTIRRRLVEQLTSPVRWAECCVELAALSAAAGTAEFHELAPGKALMGMFRRIDRGVKVQNHDEP